MIKYIELDGKVPKHSFDIFSTTHEHYNDAAILLNSSIVVVDFDERNEAIEKLFRLFPTLRVESRRGCHLYYQKPKILIKNWTGKLTVAGMTVDYKTGKKSIAVIKQDGKLRPMQKLQKVNRIFAATKKNFGGVYKVKDYKFHKTPFTSDHCIVWNDDLKKLDKRLLNLNFYIQLVKENLFT